MCRSHHRHCEERAHHGVQLVMRRLPAFVQGAVGALVVALVLGVGVWLYVRYQEFVVIRSVVFQAIRTQQAQSPRPSPTPAPTK